MTLSSPRTPWLFAAILALYGIVLGSAMATADNEGIDYEDIKVTGAVPLKLYVFDCGKITVRDMSLFDPTLPKGVTREMADGCYLIKHPKGSLFWDAGLPDALIAQQGGVDVYNGAINLAVTRTLKSQLAETGIDPESVDYIGSSHLHSDHTGNLGYFQKSTWLIQQAEYDIAFSDKATQYGFTPADYAPLKTSRTIKLKGNYDVFGDGSVVMVSTPGHSPGHQMLFVDLPKTGPVLLSGDLYHTMENRKKYAIPIWNNRRETIHSFVLADELIARTKARLWIQHDKGQFDRLKKAPAFYE